MPAVPPTLAQKLRARLSPRWIFNRATDALARDATRGFVELSDFGLSSDEQVYYSPSDRFALARLLRRLEIGPGDAFLDYGCGKGRALLAAARRPFGRVMGIDVAPPLVATASENVAR